LAIKVSFSFSAWFRTMGATGLPIGITPCKASASLLQSIYLAWT
jgi:hypothetical protein